MVCFAFKRRFLVYNFIAESDIDKFWHFDSDNMILDDLSKHEYKFKKYQCTEQCLAGCLNGLVNSSELVKNYLYKINEVFHRQDYIDSLDFGNTNHHFNEMTVYQIYRDEANIKSIPLSKAIDEEFFDDLLCKSQGFVVENLPYGEDLKRVYVANDGRFFCQRKRDKKLIRVISINLSWMPIYIYKAILVHYKKKTNKIIDDNSLAIPNIKDMKILSQARVTLRQSFKKNRKILKNYFLKQKSL